MSNERDLYNKTANVPQGLTKIELIDYLPDIKGEELKQGFVTRYFVRQANHSSGFITEISPEDYQSLQSNRLYTTVQIDWRIVGPLDDTPGPLNVNTPTRLVTGVLTANRLAVEEAEKVLPGIKLRLRNLTAFYHFG